EASERRPSPAELPPAALERVPDTGEDAVDAKAILALHALPRRGQRVVAAPRAWCGGSPRRREARGIGEIRQRAEERLVGSAQLRIRGHEVRHGEAAPSHLGLVLDR